MNNGIPGLGYLGLVGKDQGALQEKFLPLLFITIRVRVDVDGNPVGKRCWIAALTLRPLEQAGE